MFRHIRVQNQPYIQAYVRPFSPSLDSTDIKTPVGFLPKRRRTTSTESLSSESPVGKPPTVSTGLLVCFSIFPQLSNTFPFQPTIPIRPKLPPLPIHPIASNSSHTD
eukprot:m.136579 g.136579  ORF g.136579 m.136579 type:complete len:107 (+) comp23962_c2_seq4:1128-1448(+)